MKTKIFGKQMSLFDKEHPDLFTGQEKDGKKLLPSEKNPLIRRWQTDKDVTDKKNMLDNNVKNDYISGEKKNKQGETTMEATHSPIKITKGEMEFEVSPLTAKEGKLLSNPDVVFRIKLDGREESKFSFQHDVGFYIDKDQYGIQLGAHDDIVQNINKMAGYREWESLVILVDQPTYQKIKKAYNDEVEKYMGWQGDKNREDAKLSLQKKFDKAKKLKVSYSTISGALGVNAHISLPGEKLSNYEEYLLNNSAEFEKIKEILVRNYWNADSEDAFEMDANDDKESHGYYDGTYVVDKDWVMKRAEEYFQGQKKGGGSKIQERKKELLEKATKYFPAKTYLKVNFEDKDEAKKLGAKWDANKKKWYVDNFEGIEKFNNREGGLNQNDIANAIKNVLDKNFGEYDDKSAWFEFVNKEFTPAEKEKIVKEANNRMIETKEIQTMSDVIEKMLDLAHGNEDKYTLDPSRYNKNTFSQKFNLFGSEGYFSQRERKAVAKLNELYKEHGLLDYFQTLSQEQRDQVNDFTESDTNLSLLQDYVRNFNESSLEKIVQNIEQYIKGIK
jgi:hypothetical protein